MYFFILGSQRRIRDHDSLYGCVLGMLLSIQDKDNLDSRLFN
jgi:hypothetical protein